ncbi:PAS domain-containing protein [Deinococcus ruber]|uniref:PAS domain-containing protein n=1 Tax=Deinococcus ruber TaxID=1848197 RepID=A0A918CEY2_9DEIO|nr:PAS domain-containing protein [Deinococcus ruber]GGR19413.1 hypothetical protein GCM10008957_34900 [Deinococcus ruber]
MSNSTPTVDVALLSAGFHASILSTVVVDARTEDHPLIYVNPAFEQLTGYAAADVLGRNCRFLQGDRNQQDQTQRRNLREAIAAEQPVTVVLRNHRRDGTPFLCELTLRFVQDASGTLTHILGF